MNWKNGHVCGEHWSSGVRESPGTLPDVIVSKNQLLKIKKKFHQCKSKLNENSSKKQKDKVELLKKTAILIFNQNHTTADRRRLLIRRSPKKRMRTVAGIPNQLSELEKLENEKQLLVQKLEQQKLKLNALEREVLKQNGFIDFMRGKSNSYKHLKLKPERFKLLC